MKWLCFVILAFAALPLAAQKYPERRVVRAGNRAYAKSDWQAAEGLYNKALEKAPESREAAFNLGSALFKQEKWAEAAAAFEGVAKAAATSGDLSALGAASQAFYGQGTALARERKLEQALEVLKNAMRTDPTDQDAKFNYAYVKKLLEGQQGGGGGDQNKDNQESKDSQNDGQDDQNQDKQNGSQGDQNQDGQNDHNQDGENGEQNDQNGSQDGQGGENQAQSGMSREDAERMLQAMQAQEDQTQEKIDGQRQTVVVGRSGKNW